MSDVEPPRGEVPRDEKAAKLLNAVMFCALALAVTLYGLWTFIDGLSPTLAVVKGFSLEEHAIISRAVKSLAFVVVGAGLLWRAMRPIRKALWPAKP